MIKDNTEQPANEKPPRTLEFCVFDTSDNRLILKIPFEAHAGDTQIERLVRDQLRRIQMLHKAQRVVALRSKNLEVRWMALYVHDLTSRETSEPLLIPTIEESKESALASWFTAMEKACADNIGLYYDRIEAVMLHWDLSRTTMTDDDWRAVCGAAYPLFNSPALTEQKRREFILAAKEAIKKRGQRAPELKNKNGTKRLLSPHSRDKTLSVPPVKKSAKKAKDSSAKSDVASPRSKRGQRKQKNKAPRKSKTRTIRQGATHNGDKEKPRSRN
jgi:hypothetical protein